MKNQKKNILKFNKTSLIELNNKDLRNINAGVEEQGIWPFDKQDITKGKPR